MRNKTKKKGKQRNISTVPNHTAPVITLLGHKYDKNKLDPYTKIKHGAVFSVPRKDFSKFKILERNRDVNKSHRAKLISSMKEPRGQVEPITINEDWEVINGGHRLDAAIEGNLDHVIVIMSYGATIKDVIVMNTTQKKWNFWDFLKCHSHKTAPNHAPYQKVKKFLKDYPISHQAALWMLSGNNHDNGMEDFEEGKFKILHQEEAQKQGDLLRKVKGYKTVDVSVTKFCWAFVKIQNATTHKKYGLKPMSMAHLMKNLKKYGGKFFNTGGNREYYLEEMKECYNTRQPANKKLTLRVSL